MRNDPQNPLQSAGEVWGKKLLQSSKSNGKNEMVKMNYQNFFLCLFLHVKQVNVGILFIFIHEHVFLIIFGGVLSRMNDWKQNPIY